MHTRRIDAEKSFILVGCKQHTLVRIGIGLADMMKGKNRWVLYDNYDDVTEGSINPNPNPVFGSINPKPNPLFEFNMFTCSISDIYLWNSYY